MNYIILVIVGLVCFWLGRRTGSKGGVGFTAIPAEKLKALQRDAHEALEERTAKRKIAQMGLKWTRCLLQPQNPLIPSKSS